MKKGTKYKEGTEAQSFERHKGEKYKIRHRGTKFYKKE